MARSFVRIGAGLPAAQRSAGGWRGV